MWVQVCSSELVLSVAACFDGELYLIHWWKMCIVPALSNMGAWNRASRDPKPQLSHKRCLLVHCPAGMSGCPHKCMNLWKWSFWALFCGCIDKTSTVCHQWTRWSSPSKQGSYAAIVSTQHWLRHIIMSALHQD